MDELDSQFPYPLMDSHSILHFDLIEYNIPNENKEQTPIDTQHSVHEDHDNDSQDKLERRHRVDNNIFKTPLSEFRKLMKHFFAKKKIQSEAFTAINKQNRNFSTFPKYWVLCAKLGCKDQLKEQFKSGISGYLQKKKDKMSKKRYDELQRVYQRMSRSLECSNIEEAVREYWGRFRQKSKFMESYEEIGRFQKFLETIN